MLKSFRGGEILLNVHSPSYYTLSGFSDGKKFHSQKCYEDIEIVYGGNSWVLMWSKRIRKVKYRTFDEAISHLSWALKFNLPDTNGVS